MITFPAAFGVKLIFPLLAVEEIVSLSIVNSSTNTLPTLSSDQFSKVVPNLYVSVTAGIMSLSILALILIVSVVSSPKVILPPTVTLPDTSKFPVILTLSNKLIVPDELFKLISPLVLAITFPLILILPDSTFVPSIIVVLTPSVKVIPWLLLNKNSAFVKVTSPVD